MIPIPLAVKMVPRWVWIAVGTLAVAGLLVWRLDAWGDARYAEGRSDLLAEQRQAADKIEDEQEEVTVRVVTKYVDRVRIVREKGDTIIQRVPVYVTREDDSACTINAGFVRLWNDANAGEVSESPAGADAAPSEVVLSDVGTQKSIEAKLCRETEEQLISLQEWVREQQALFPPPD